MNTMVKGLFAMLASGLTAAALVGCAVPVDSQDPAEETESVQQAVGNCSCAGAYVCASNNYDVSYDQPGCGLSKPAAASACKSHCGNVACRDTGWICN
jgi:hypothetical protein